MALADSFPLFPQDRRSQNKLCSIVYASKDHSCNKDAFRCGLKTCISVKKAIRALKLWFMSYEVFFISTLLISAYASAMISLLLRQLSIRRIILITWVAAQTMQKFLIWKSIIVRYVEIIMEASDIKSNISAVNVFRIRINMTIAP